MIEIDVKSRIWTPFDSDSLAYADRIAIIHQWERTKKQVAAFEYNGKCYMVFIQNGKMYWGISN